MLGRHSGLHWTWQWQKLPEHGVDKEDKAAWVIDGEASKLLFFISTSLSYVALKGGVLFLNCFWGAKTKFCPRSSHKNRVLRWDASVRPKFRPCWREFFSWLNRPLVSGSLSTKCSVFRGEGRRATWNEHKSIFQANVPTIVSSDLEILMLWWRKCEM